jgi:predicted lysophospholipase L1 biosynthesis ABC-type transport system permease subunit
MRTDMLNRAAPGFSALARLKPGTGSAAAESALSAAAARLTAPKSNFFKLGAVTALPLAEARVHPARRPAIRQLVSTLLVVSSLVLAIGCFNVAMFLLGRAATRSQEIGVRFAIGASRSRVVSQLLMEALVLAAFAALAGLGLAILLTKALVLLPDLYGRVTLDVGPIFSARVFAFTAGTALVTGLAFGLLPAVVASRRSPWAALATERHSTAALGHVFSRQGLLLGLQVAFTVALVATAAVYYRSLREMATVDVGYATDRLLVAHMGAHSLTDAEGADFQRRLLQKFEARGDVVKTAFSGCQSSLEMSPGLTR